MAIAHQYDSLQIGSAKTLPLPWRNAALLLACTIPLWFSLPTIGDPYGQTEEGVNNAIWALGGRNIIRRGPIAAKLGAVVAPYPGTGGGVYAHHPPLPIWLSALIQTITNWEGAPRLLALVLVALSLAVLFSMLTNYVSETTALVSVAVVALSPWVLIYSRMLTTLTVATPLFAVLLRSVLLRVHGNRAWGVPTLLVIAALVLSSWDGVIGSAVLVATLSWAELRDAFRGNLRGRAWLRVIAPAIAWTTTLAALLVYLIKANHGPGELIGQAVMRSGLNQFDAVAWTGDEIRYAGEGLGWLTLILLAGAYAVCGRLPQGRRLYLATSLAAVPGMGMILLFRNGAHWHDFWGYNLFLAAGFGVAAVLEFFRRALPEPAKISLLFLLGGQSTLAARSAGAQLEREHNLNQLGVFVKQNLATAGLQNVKMFWAYDFHPYIAWYLEKPQDVSLSLPSLQRKVESGQWKREDQVVVDNLFAANLRCRGLGSRIDSSTRRWSITSVGELENSCQGH